jgi:hypothetical protein
MPILLPWTTCHIQKRPSISHLIQTWGYMHRRQRKMDHPNHRPRSRPHRTRVMILHHYQRPRHTRHHVHLGLPSLSEGRIQGRTSHFIRSAADNVARAGNKKSDPRQDFITDLIQLIKNKQSIQTMVIDIREAKPTGSNAKPPFSAIPFEGTGPLLADDILNGEFHYKPSGPHGRYLQLLLHSLQRKLPDLPVDIMEQDITKGFRVWKEITSTSPSNRHLGQYISLLSHGTTKSLATDIMHTHYQTTAICAKLGISLNMWQ